MSEWTSSPAFEEKIRQSFGVPEIRLEFVNHVHAELMQRAATKSHKFQPYPRLRPAWAIALALLTLIIIGILAIGPQRVYAAFIKLFGYIPDVGVVDMSAPLRVLAEPVTLTRDGITVTVTSATLTAEKTKIAYRIFGVPASAYPDREDVAGCVEQAYLRLTDGTQLAQINYGYEPVPANVNEAVFVIPCIANTLPGKAPENWALPLRFMPAPPDLTVVPVIESLPSPAPSAMADTPAPEINPLTITKVFDIGDQYVLMGEFSYSDARDSSLPAGSWWAIKGISIVGADGREVPQTYSNDFELSAPTRADTETWLYQLDKNFVPPVTITYTGEIISPVGVKEQVEFEFDTQPDPQNGNMWTVNEDFKLGGYNIRLVSIESSVRGYSFRFKADPGASANAISVDIVGYSPNCGGGGGGDQFPELNVQVCYADFAGAPEFPHGKLKAVLNFQALARQNQSFQVQWVPDTAQTGAFATSTPEPGVCLTTGSLAQLQPVPPALATGKALIYEKLDTGTWGLAIYALDGSQKQVVVPSGNWGALSPDGSQVAYSATDGLIHIIDLASRAEKVLPGGGGFNLHWSPDGKQIAYVGVGAGAVNSVFVIDTGGAQARQVSDMSYESVIGWSPDDLLYFVAPYTGGAAWKVYAYDFANNAAQERFTIENGTAKFLNPKLSPDGNWIAYRGRDNSSVYLVRTDGSDMRLVLDNAGAGRIEWSRSGWLGASLRKANSDETTIVMIRPEGCEGYRLPDALHGDLEGFFIP